MCILVCKSHCQLLSDRVFVHRQKSVLAVRLHECVMIQSRCLNGWNKSIALIFKNTNIRDGWILYFGVQITLSTASQVVLVAESQTLLSNFPPCWRGSAMLVCWTAGEIPRQLEDGWRRKLLQKFFFFLICRIISFFHRGLNNWRHYSCLFTAV